MHTDTSYSQELSPSNQLEYLPSCPNVVLVMQLGCVNLWFVSKLFNKLVWPLPLLQHYSQCFRVQSLQNLTVGLVELLFENLLHSSMVAKVAALTTRNGSKNFINFLSSQATTYPVGSLITQLPKHLSLRSVVIRCSMHSLSGLNLLTKQHT